MREAVLLTITLAVRICTASECCNTLTVLMDETTRAMGLSSETYYCLGDYDLVPGVLNNGYPYYDHRVVDMGGMETTGRHVYNDRSIYRPNGAGWRIGPHEDASSSGRWVEDYDSPHPDCPENTADWRGLVSAQLWRSAPGLTVACAAPVSPPCCESVTIDKTLAKGDYVAIPGLYQARTHAISHVSPLMMTWRSPGCLRGAGQCTRPRRP